MSDNQGLKQSVLLNNLNIIKSIAEAVKGTFGSQGLDVMLVDEFSNYTITNDGVKILSLIETNHPAAKILIEAAKFQEEQVGDGTTTVTILVEALLSEAVKQVEKGVPIPKLIEGLRLGLNYAKSKLTELASPIENLKDHKLRSACLIAGRGETELIDLLLKAAETIGLEKLKAKDFKFAKTIIAKNQTESQIIEGIILNKNRVNSAMPASLEKVKVFIIDDSLIPEDFPEEAISTEQGFAHFKQLQGNFLAGIKQLIDLKVNLVLIGGNLHPYAEELFTQNNIMAVQRVRKSELYRAVQFTGANLATRRTLNLAEAELEKFCGFIESAREDQNLDLIRLEGCLLPERQANTIIIGAAIEAFLAEKERIASDIASSLQACLDKGVVAGGGATELALSYFLNNLKKDLSQNSSFVHYGIDCWIEALKAPLSQISQNLGLNPLEKLAQVLSAQANTQSFSLGINAENGELACMQELGVFDPLSVKLLALNTACEVTIQLLKVNIIIKSKTNI